MMSEVPQFFSIIGRQVLQRNKVQIPKKIVKKCRDSLKDQVLFKLPCGLDWKIGLTKSSDGKVWIDKGWREFSKHYSLAFGHFLVFGYQGNSQFQVNIFDDHTIEIDYINSFKKDDADTSPSPCHTRATMKSQLPSRVSSHGSRGKLNLLNKQSKSEKSANYRTSKRDDMSEALKKMTGFKCNRPFFIREIKPFSLGLGCSQLTVTSNFAKSHLGIGMKPVILKVGDGKKHWSVNYSSKGSNQGRFGSGWNAFARDNTLNIGDICAFAMTKTIKSIVFEVTIYRKNENTDYTSIHGIRSKKPKLVCSNRSVNTRISNTSLLNKSSAKKEPEELLVEKDDTSCEVKWSSRAFEAAGHKQKFCSKHPFFQVDFLLSPNEVPKLSIPVWFARSYLEAKTQVASLRMGERSWDVKILYYDIKKCPSVVFSRGWSVFVNDNSLRRGDLCVFELIKSEQAVFNVTVFRDQV